MATTTTSYVWSTFDLDSALAGTLVGIQQLNPSDLSKTGKLMRETSFKATPYKVIIDGYPIWVNENGLVKVCSANPDLVNNVYLKMVTATIATTQGTRAITRSSGGTEDVVTVTTFEPRDQFAIQAMSALMAKLDHPENYDDAGILQVCQASYRWAKGMLQAAADARADDPTPSPVPSTVEVGETELNSVSEKLLYNMTQYMKTMVENGLPIVGSSDEGALPAIIKLDENSKIAEITEITEANVTIDGTPNVTVTNANWATSQQLTSAKNEIINEMPSGSFPSDYAKQDTLLGVASTVDDIAAAVVPE